MSKNAGKTTAMNYVIKKHSPDTLALTSIGLDGETLDQITFLPKPKIHVFKGMIAATAKDTLKHANFSYRILKDLNMPSAMGDILIIEILSEGNILLAGPTTKKELNKIITSLKTIRLNILVDGALNRKTFAATPLIDLRLKDFTLIVDDATKLLINQKSFQYLNKLNINLEVIHPLMLDLITVNPHSVYSDSYDSDNFKQALKKHTSIKVINVLETE